MNVKRKGFSLANNPLLSGPAFEERAKGGIPYKEIPLSAIEADPNQPRTMFDPQKLEELSESIKLYGILSPILVRPSKLPARYLLISGERRFRAAHLAGLSSIPAIVSANSDETGDAKTLALQLVENLQRADLSPLERSHAIGALRDAHQLSIRDIAERLSISKSAVQRSLEILELPDDLLNALREGASESKVLLLAKIEDEAVRKSYLNDLDTLTRSQLEKDLDKRKSKDEEEAEAEKIISAEDVRLAEEMQRAIGLKVKLTRSHANASGGRLIIEFYSEADLQEIFRKLVGEV